jgi:metallophosphoesterase (TIGR00282 family)
MKILFLGDVVGRAGRDAVCAKLPALKQQYALDAVIINGENAAGGFGLTPEIFEDFIKAGADVVTTGDHVWDQDKLLPRLNQESRLLRAYNFPTTTPGRGITEVMISGGRKLVVLHLMGQVFMKLYLDSPFAAAEKALAGYRLGSSVAAIVVDFHAEATSEKCAMGIFLDGKVSAVIGTHTHIPTADARILPLGTGYQTDAGMCGDYNSVIGMESDVPLTQFLNKRKGRMKPAMGDATLCGVILETDDQTGLCQRIQTIRLGGVLHYGGES